MSPVTDEGSEIDTMLRARTRKSSKMEKYETHKTEIIATDAQTIETCLRTISPAPKSLCPNF